MVCSTGATGYIGGDALHTIAKAHPDYEFSCLVRSVEKGAIVTKEVPSARLVYGDLDDFDLLADEAFNADIVCHWASCEPLASAQAIAAGLSRKSAAKQGFWIHLSGSDIICFPDVDAEEYGVQKDKRFDDWNSLGEILSVKETAAHRDVDLTVLGVDLLKAKTAIVCPPTIYGPGRGPGNKRSIQVPELAAYTLKRGAGLTVQGGRNIWSTVHVQDLSNLFLKLAEEAAKGRGVAHWGNKGFYFAENGELVWRDIAQRIAEEAYKQGFIKTTELQSLSAKEADEVWPYASFFWGTNSRCKAIRARNVLNWTPQQEFVYETLATVVAQEAKALGISK